MARKSIADMAHEEINRFKGYLAVVHMGKVLNVCDSMHSLLPDMSKTYVFASGAEMFTTVTTRVIDLFQSIAIYDDKQNDEVIDFITDRLAFELNIQRDNLAKFRVAVIDLVKSLYHVVLCNKNRMMYEQHVNRKLPLLNGINHINTVDTISYCKTPPWSFFA